MPNVIPFPFAWQPETVMLFPCRSTLRFVIFAVRISLTVQLREVKYGITGLSAVFAGVLPLRFPFIWNMVIAFRVFGTAERSQLSNAAANLSANIYRRIHQHPPRLQTEHDIFHADFFCRAR